MATVSTVILLFRGNGRWSLSGGLVDTGFGRMTAAGEWVNKPGEQRTSARAAILRQQAGRRS